MDATATRPAPGSPLPVCRCRSGVAGGRSGVQLRARRVAVRWGRQVHRAQQVL